MEYQRRLRCSSILGCNDDWRGGYAPGREASTSQGSMDMQKTLTSSRMQLGIATTVLGENGSHRIHFRRSNNLFQGILTTLAGAFLTKVRAGGEPETSTIQAHDLNQFVRKCEAFQIDHGHEVGDRHNDEIKQYRDDLELILRQKQIEYVHRLSSHSRICTTLTYSVRPCNTEKMQGD